MFWFILIKNVMDCATHLPLRRSSLICNTIKYLITKHTRKYINTLYYKTPIQTRTLLSTSYVQYCYN